MKLKFCRRWYDDSKKDSTLAVAIALEPINEEWGKKWETEWKKEAPDRVLTSAMARENALKRPYSTYLAGCLVSDFLEHHPELCDEALKLVESLERGETETAEWGGNGFCHSMTRDKVTFEHAIFGECPEWPLWSCTLAQYKAAVQGWRQFISLPKNIDCELVVELPEAA